MADPGRRAPIDPEKLRAFAKAYWRDALGVGKGRGGPIDPGKLRAFAEEYWREALDVGKERA